MAASSTRNHLLNALPADLVARLSPHFHVTTLAVRKTLMAPNAKVEAAYFVESGWVSLVQSLDDGSAAEVGIVGREGMVGLPLVTGVDTAFVDAFVQADGTALRMDASTLRRAMQEEPEFRSLMLRYVELTLLQVTQTAACNGRHALEHRLAR
jgi:CRP-like cAMP-binding protein